MIFVELLLFSSFEVFYKDYVIPPCNPSMRKVFFPLNFIGKKLKVREENKITQLSSCQGSFISV